MIKVIILLLTGNFLGNIFAQEPLRYTTKQGLPSNHIYDIAEDEKGFMWFATKNGLVKYDGENFKNFTIKDGLPNNDTWLLETDLKSRLWYFSKSKYQGFIKNDSIYKFSTKEQKVLSPLAIYKSKDSIWTYDSSDILTFSKTKIINVGFFSKENLDEFNLKIAKIRKTTFSKTRQLPLLFTNPQSKEYIIFNNEKLIIYDWKLNFKNDIRIKTPAILSNKIIEREGLLYDQIGYYAFDQGVLFIDFKNYSVKFLSFLELFGVKKVKYFRCRGVKNEIQISIPGYLKVMDYQFNTLNTYSFPIKLGKSSYKDSKGNIWLIDLANGVSLLPASQINSKYFLQNQKVIKINNLQGSLYAGVNDIGFYKFNREKQNFSKIFNIDHANSKIYQIKGDPVSNLSYLISQQLSYKNLKEFNLRDPNDSLSSVDNQGIKDIVLYKGINYILTSQHVLKNKNGSLNTTSIATKAGLIATEIYKDKVFVAGSDGLFLVRNDHLEKPNFKSELFNAPINCLTSSKDLLFVGTDGNGIYLYDNNKLIHLKETDGLSVQRIIQRENFLWVATQNGIKKIELKLNNLEQSKIIDEFYDADGLLENNTNDIYLENNFLYAASDLGLAKLNLKNVNYKRKPIIYFKTKNDTVNFKNKDRDNIEVTFALQDYSNQEYTTYQYRLLPIQKEWQSTETKILNFSNLSPQLYTLEVKATNQHQISTVKSQFLNIIPQWWQTTIAKIGFIILITVLLYLIYLLFKKQITKSEQQKANNEKRIAGLELQALRSQMNPHFVHNSLNAIQYYIQRNEVDHSENYLSKFSQLIRLFFEYSRRQSITIKEELELLTNYLEIEKLRFEEKLHYNISVCDKVDVDEQLIPSMLLQPIVENAVNHGLFHKKESGTVELTFQQLNANTYQVTIKDDGIGIKKAKLIYKSSSKNYQSNSSKVIHERLELLNKSKEWNISYDIQDISDTDLDKTGTKVSLIFEQKP